MKVLVALTLLMACCYASASLPKHILEKLVPRFATTNVIKGDDAEPHSAPYIVSLSLKFSRRHSHICGGSIITKSWILTAAHCVREPVGMGVVAGLHERLDVDNETTQAREVDFGRIHESYGGNVGPYDIAILHVSKPFVINEWVQPAVLPHRHELHTGEIHLYGWGQPKPYNPAGAKTLQTVQTNVMDWKECQNMLPENSPLHDSNICSDSMQEGISACNGDSGGPLVKQCRGAPSELVGIVSWGYIPCGVTNMPSIYTRVSAHIDWLHMIMSAYNILH